MGGVGAAAGSGERAVRLLPGRAASSARLLSLVDEVGGGAGQADRAALEVIREVARREDRILASRMAPAWFEFCERAPSRLRRRDGAWKMAVVANALALAALADPVDYARLESLVEAYGVRAVGDAQWGMFAVMPAGANALRTAYLLALGAGARGPVWVRGDSGLAARVGSMCIRVGTSFLLADVADPRQGPPAAAGRGTPRMSLAQAARSGEEIRFSELRRHVARIAADPWADDVRAAHEVAELLDCPVLSDALVHVIREARERAQDKERIAVADSIRRLVAESGLSQREFAERVATSPSRLSTYITGSVTPSAAMMLRIERIARLAQRDTAPPSSSSAQLLRSRRAS